MKKTMVLISSTVFVLVLVVGFAIAQGQGSNPPGQPFAGLQALIDDLKDAISDLEDAIDDADITSLSVVASPDHGDASDGYAGADVVESLELGEGNWKITATGAVTLTGDATALNCGLRVEDGDSGTGYKMLAKQNPAVGGEEGRVGFGVVGAAEGPATVELVCYGGGNLPFEHNMVAIGG